VQAEKLAALSPDGVLKRGYAIVRKLATGAIITDADSLGTGERVGITFGKGQREARIE
jgi:exonuclease VII large subunit